MIELPAALAPWREWLGYFPREIALGLGPWLRRLALAIGPLRTRREEGPGEPDGFEGLARRGPYERLLASEWLLADEVPEEFLRRAASGEHGFFRLARKEPARARVSLALLDAGPEQLGAPRILHMAALIALAQRAGSAGAEFRWTTLQQHDETEIANVTPATMRRLLAARSPFCASDADLTARFARIANGRPEDVWVIGAPALAASAARRGLGMVDVTEVLEPGVRRLRAGVRRPAGTRAEIDLDLPSEAQCVRLLRDPFVTDAPARASTGVPSGVEPASNLVFAPSGRKLLARLPGGSLVTFGVPNSPHDALVKPRVYSSAKWGETLAVHWCRRWVTTLVVAREVLPRKRSARYLEPLLFSPHELPFELPPGGAVADLPLGVMLGASDPHGVSIMFPSDLLLVDHHATLWLLERKSKSSWTRLAEHVTALAPYRNAVTYVAGGAAPTLVARDFVRNHVVTEALEGDGTFAAHFGYGTYKDSLGLVAVQQFADHWTVYSYGSSYTVRPVAGARVVGVGTGIVGVNHLSSGRAEGLVLIEADGRTVSMQNDQSVHTLFVAKSPVVHACVNHAGPQLAYVTAAGDVGVYSLHTGRMLRVVETRRNA